MKTHLRQLIGACVGAAGVFVASSALAWPWNPPRGHESSAVPEINTGGAAAGAALVLGGAAVILSRRKRRI